MSTTQSSDIFAIHGVIASLVHHLDAKRWPLLRPLFCERVRTDYTSLFGGAVQEQLADALIDGWRALLTPVVTQHLLGPIYVRAAGSTAEANCHVRAYHHRDGAPDGGDWVVAGHYVFSLERAPSEWQIRGITLETLHQSGNQAVLQVAR